MSKDDGLSLREFLLSKSRNIRVTDPRHPYNWDFTPPYEMEGAPDGSRALCPVGPWTTATEEAVWKERPDSLVLSYVYKFEGEPTLRFLPTGLPVRRLAVLYGIESFDGIEALGETLELLDIDRCGPQACVNLQGLPCLQSLSAHWSQFACSLSQASPELRKLNVVGGYPGSTLEDFPLSDQLEELVLNTPARLESLAGLEQFTRLRRLEVLYASRLSGLTGPAAAPPLLEDLRFWSCSRMKSIAGLQGLTRLRKLELNNCARIDSIGPLRSLVRLETLHAWGTTRIMDEDLTPVAELPRLKKLNMAERKQYRPLVEEIQRSRGLRTHG